MRLRTIQLALEILTGVCATLPDFEVPEGDAAEDEDDEDGTLKTSNISRLSADSRMKQR